MPPVVSFASISQSSIINGFTSVPFPAITPFSEETEHRPLYGFGYEAYKLEFWWIINESNG